MPDYVIESWSYNYEIMYWLQTKTPEGQSVDSPLGVKKEQVLEAGFFVIG